jgi:tetratricopeptide (TPR) repeat protein
VLNVVKRVLVVAAVALVVLAANAARADPESEAQEHFKRGVKLYNLGHFQEAIPEFEKAYDLDPQPILLFNIAQSHRQNGNKERALFFYRRYLEQEPNATKRADVEQRMKELSQSLEQENEQKQKPPTEVSPPPPGLKTASPQPTVPAPVAPPPVVTAEPPPPASAIPVRLAFALGPSFASLSTQQNIDLPVLFGLELGASYDFLHGPSGLRAGVEMQYAALPYTNRNTRDQQSSALWGALLTIDYAYRVIEQLSIGGGLAGGIVWWAGLADGNPFTAANASVSGAIPMPTFALSLHADYLITPHLFVTLNPAFVYSKTTSEGLTQVTSSVERFDLDFGVGYRF